MCCTLLASAASAQTDSEAGVLPARANGFAVVELFTSQGCNSCPPADALLRELDAEAKEKGLSLYTLSFHVDYWNRLGWKDPYSGEFASRRQRAYASRHNWRVYTPQMIVVGTTDFVGSKKSKAQDAIKEALVHEPKAKISLQVDSKSSEKRLLIRYQVDGAGSRSLINVALVNTPKPNEVASGENEGRVLSHVNVVRAFDAKRLEQKQGEVGFRLPDDVDLSDCTVVAYVQDFTSLSIVGAASIPAQAR